MITVWFLIALMSYPGFPAISYKGFGGFIEKEECEEKKIITENKIVQFEIQRGNTAVYVKIFCLEMNAFKSQLEKKKQLNKIEGLGT